MTHVIRRTGQRTRGGTESEPHPDLLVRKSFLEKKGIELNFEVSIGVSYTE